MVTMAQNVTPSKNNGKKNKSLVSRLFRSPKKPSSSSKTSSDDHHTTTPVYSTSSGSGGGDGHGHGSSDTHGALHENHEDEYDGLLERRRTSSSQQKQQQPYATLRERSAPDDEYAYNKKIEKEQQQQLSRDESSRSDSEQREQQHQQQQDKLIPIRTTPPRPMTSQSGSRQKKKQQTMMMGDGSNPSKSIRTSKSGPMSLKRAALTRPFGRSSLPPFCRKYIVSIDPKLTTHEDEADGYVYHIRVMSEGMPRIKCTRTLCEFVWLEGTLRMEFNGALLVPLLSEYGILQFDDITYPSTDDLLTSRNRVNEIDLENWLSDVLNGVRGQGELILQHPKVCVFTSLAVEAFLYRNTTLPALERPDINSSTGSHGEKSMVAAWRAFTTKPFQCFANTLKEDDFGHLLSKCDPMTFDDDYDNSKRISSKLGTIMSPPSADVQLHNPTLEAYRILIMKRLRMANMALKFTKKLISCESSRNTLWKRFAVSISNLYGFELDICGSKVGTGNNGFEPLQPKIKKDGKMDDSLRMMIRQKNERYLPQLSHLYTLMNSYAKDLSQASPSFDSFLYGISKVVSNHDPKKITFTPGKSIDWQTIKQMATQHLQKDSSDACDEVANEAFETRLRENEGIMMDFLKMLIRGTHIRNSRTAYKYFKMEAGQALLLANCAKDLSQSFQTESSREPLHSDLDDVEMTLVRKMVTIGNPDLLDDGNNLAHSSENIDDDDLTYRQGLCITALNNLSQRRGRWDSKLALEIMEAAGIEDAEVRVEETTRELRQVRKYAIGLRTCLTRCFDAMKAVEDDLKNLVKARSDFFTAFTGLLGGAYVLNPALSSTQGGNSASELCYNSSPPMQALSSVGVDVIDRAGWLTPVTEVPRQNSKFHRAHCGHLSRKYIELRPVAERNLFRDMKDSLKEYEFRVEQIESFVYMHCVGIQLEKHYSRYRSNAVAAWEKKTDITTAINIATKKKLPLLVEELRDKLEALPTSVSHTSVKQAKERHLISKQIKTQLHELASRRFERAKATATERVHTIVRSWTDFEISSVHNELKLLEQLVVEIEDALTKSDIVADGGSHCFIPGQAAAEAAMNEGTVGVIL